MKAFILFFPLVAILADLALVGCDTINGSVDTLRGSLQQNIDPKWLGNQQVITSPATTNNIINAGGR